MTTPYLTSQHTSSTDAASGLRLGGDWTLAHYSQLEPQVLAL
ncbi:MAG TPA: ABC transporter permease, partial [Pseudomonas sp.]|nr:ABC transporter permease [Pseudomonas sp.]